MRRVGLLALALLLGPGCAADKGQWDEFWKDVRGENMQMRTHFGSQTGLSDQSSRLKYDD